MLLWLAAKNGYIDLVNLLIIGDADVNAKTGNYGETALMLAAQRGYLYVVNLLMTKGTIPLLQAKTHLSSQATAIPLAKKANHLEIVKLLAIAQKKYEFNQKWGTLSLLIAQYFSSNPTPSLPLFAFSFFKKKRDFLKNANDNLIF